MIVIAMVGRNGKTTIIKAIIRIFEEAGLTVSLAAPTGRAAKRMTETTGIEARKFIGYWNSSYMEEEMAF